MLHLRERHEISKAGGERGNNAGLSGFIHIVARLVEDFPDFPLNALEPAEVDLVKGGHQLELLRMGFLEGLAFNSEEGQDLICELVITHYECDDCSDCTYKKSCTKAKGNRKMQVFKRFVQQRAESLGHITSSTGILLRTNRSIQSEGAFGMIKQNYGSQQFLLWGSKKVLTEILIVAMAYDLNKLHAKIQQNQTGTQLFGKLPA